MYLSTSIWTKIFLVFVIYNRQLNALDEYEKFYYNAMQIDKGSPPFIIDALWEGVSNMDQLSQDESECSDDIKAYKQAVTNEKQWALKMFDSSTHLHSGFLEGNVIDYGNTEECIKVRVENKKRNFKGKICEVVFQTDDHNLPMVKDRYKISFAICIPSSCSKYQLTNILRHGISFVTYLYVSDCFTEDTFSPPYDDKAYYIILFFIGLITIILVSTLYDVIKSKCCNVHNEDKSDTTLLISHNKQNVSTFQGVLLSFSLYSNGKTLLEEDTKAESIKVLHGLRFFSALGVICVHRHLVDPQPFTNMFMIDKEMRKWYRMIQFNAYIWVDVFFLMSGLLVSYTFIMKSEHKRRLNIWKFYLHRYVRLTPTLLAVILLSLLTDHICDGPHCVYFNWLFQERCEKNWWSTLLYINNIYDEFNMCLIQSWYLSADMQMYWVAPMLLYTLIRWPRFIFIELNLLFVATVVYVFFISYKLGLIPSYIGTSKFFEDDSKYIYNQFYARAGPWLIGFALGIILQRHNNEPIKLSKFSVVLGWMIGTTFCIATMFGMALFVQEDYERNPIFDSLYKALYRDVWALGFCWIIFACYIGHGGWLNKFLSSYIFHPISRLTYSFYLIHIFGQFLIFKNSYLPRRYDDFSQFAILSGDVVIGIILAAILHLTVEAPGLSLQKALWNRKAPKNVLTGQKFSLKETLEDLELHLKGHTHKRMDSIDDAEIIVYDKTKIEMPTHGREEITIGLAVTEVEEPKRRIVKEA